MAEFMPKWQQTGERGDRRRGRAARLRAGVVVAAVVLAPATALLAAGAPLTAPATAQTTDPPPPPPPPDCIDDPASTLPPDSPTSVPICQDTTTTTSTTVPPTTTTAPHTTTTKPKSTTTTTTPPSSNQGDQPAPGNGFGPAPAGGGPAPGGPAPAGGIPTAGGILPIGPAAPGAAVTPLPPLSSLPGYSLVPGTDTLIGPGGVAVTADTRSTAQILALLAPLHLPQRVLNRLFAPFPLAGNGTYPGTGSPAGVDIAANPGTQVISSLDGTVHLDQGPGPGLRTATLTASDGTTHVLSHLDGFAPDLVEGQHVSAGDPIGGAGGATAPGDTPRVHFDLHPGGGPAADPSPTLDQWLARALINAQALTGRGGRKDPSSFSANGIHNPLKRTASVGSPGAATMLPGLAMVGLAVWFGTTRVMRRRREGGAASDLAVEFAGPVDLASRFVVRPPSPGPTQPWWLAWWQPQSWTDAVRSRIRERRFKWR